jgi:hypothetical protein
MEDTEVQEGVKYWKVDKATNLIEYVHWLLKLLIPINFLGGYLFDIQGKFVPEVLESVCKLLIYVDSNFNREVVVKTKDGKIKGVMKQAKETATPGLPLLYSSKGDKADSAKFKTLPLRAFFSIVSDILRLSSTLVHVN